MANDKIVGKTTSAAYGFRIGAPIALALLDAGFKADENMKLKINIAGKFYSASLKTGPTFDPEGKRMRVKPIAERQYS